MDATPDLPRQSRVPVFNMPGIVTASIAILLAIHAVREVIPDTIDVQILTDLAFIPARWTAAVHPARAVEILRAAGDAGGGPALAAARQEFAQAILADEDASPWTFATYALLHGSWMHCIFNVVWLAAFGSPIARRYGAWRYLALAVLGAVAGSVLHLCIDPLSVMPLVGASAGISALMAGAARFVFTAPPAFAATVPWQLPPREPLQSVPELLRNRSAVLFLGIWLVTNFLFGVVALPLGAGDGPVAWDAHLGGFAVGFFLLPLLELRRRTRV